MNNQLQQAEGLKIIIAGGGTGGHVFPAIAIATSLKNKVKDVKILFVGAKGRMEMKKVPEAGFNIIGLNVAGIQRKFTLKNLVVPFKLMQSLIRAKKIVKQFDPDVVVGVGGYASAPILRTASKMGMPTLIQEQNSYPGLTNRLLAKKATKICVAYEGMERFFDKSKILLTGNPVRQDVVSLDGKKPEAMEFFKLENDKPVVLVTGGSLGARTINESIDNNLEVLLENGIQVIWQTGSWYFQKASQRIQGIEKGVVVKEFISRMDLAYAAANVVVSRAGAIAVSEICATRKPAILIPSPNVAEDHQTKNALALVNQHAALLVKDIEANQLLASTLINLIGDKALQSKLKERLATLSFRNAADVIADVVIDIARKK